MVATQMRVGYVYGLYGLLVARSHTCKGIVFQRSMRRMECLGSKSLDIQDLV
jgi:hypothetical protein